MTKIEGTSLETTNRGVTMKKTVFPLGIMFRSEVELSR